MRPRARAEPDAALARRAGLDAGARADRRRRARARAGRAARRDRRAGGAARRADGAHGGVGGARRRRAAPRRARRGGGVGRARPAARRRRSASACPTAQAQRADAAAQLAAGDARGALDGRPRRRSRPPSAVGARRDAAQALLLAGRALAAQGETEAATRELAAAEAALDAAGARRRREEAAQELRRLGHRVARRPRPASAPAGAGLEQLTEREREIAELVTERHTNRQIAGRAVPVGEDRRDPPAQHLRQARRRLPRRGRARRRARPRLALVGDPGAEQAAVVRDELLVLARRERARDGLHQQLRRTPASRRSPPSPRRRGRGGGRRTPRRPRPRSSRRRGAR